MKVQCVSVSVNVLSTNVPVGKETGRNTDNSQVKLLDVSSNIWYKLPGKIIDNK